MVGTRASRRVIRGGSKANASASFCLMISRIDLFIKDGLH
jgi:hypothetical protein